MTLWIVLECGYEYGSAEVAGTFKTYDEANKYLKEMMNLREEAEREWLWYDIKKNYFHTLMCESSARALVLLNK